MTAVEHPDVPNHHAHFPGFSGVSGLVAALSMTVGRDGDAEIAARLTEIDRGDALVDVGCGPGAAARHAGKLGASVTGVDPAEVMLRVARLLTWRSRSVRYVQGQAEALPVPDASATVLWTLASVHHWSDVDAGLREARRVLRPGGRLLAIEHQRQPGAQGLASHGWTTAQAERFAEQCEAHGFTDPRVERHDGGRRPAVSVLAIG